jgi:hypothetical protein
VRYATEERVQKEMTDGHLHRVRKGKEGENKDEK